LLIALGRIREVAFVPCDPDPFLEEAEVRRNLWYLHGPQLHFPTLEALTTRAFNFSDEPIQRPCREQPGARDRSDPRFQGVTTGREKISRKDAKGAKPAKQDCS